jgi:hypothetical protein
VWLNLGRDLRRTFEHVEEQKTKLTIFIYIIIEDNIKKLIKNAGTLTLCKCIIKWFYPGADKFLARPTFRCILFGGENISFDASLVIYIYITNIPPIIINGMYETQNLLSL